MQGTSHVSQRACTRLCRSSAMTTSECASSHRGYRNLPVGVHSPHSPLHIRDHMHIPTHAPFPSRPYSVSPFPFLVVSQRRGSQSARCLFCVHPCPSPLDQARMPDIVPRHPSCEAGTRRCPLSASTRKANLLVLALAARSGMIPPASIMPQTRSRSG